jgi:transposase-like protein
MDRALVYSRVLDELVRHALHRVEQYANNSIEADHGRLKSRLRPMRGLKRHRSVQTVAAEYAFVQKPTARVVFPSRGFVLPLWQLSFVRPRASPR